MLSPGKILEIFSPERVRTLSEALKSSQTPPPACYARYPAAGIKLLVRIWLLNMAEPPWVTYTGFVYFYLNVGVVMTASISAKGLLECLK